MTSLWKRLPVIAQAVLSGFAAAAAGTLPWAGLAALNLKYWPAVPWAVPPAALYLWIFWRYVRGAGWPRSTAAARRTNVRANALADNVWSHALLAGGLGLAALVALLRVLNQVVHLPQKSTTDLTNVPGASLFMLLGMSAAVAGIVEEVSFRGIMQAPIERSYGPFVAILVTGSVFGLVHLTHLEVTLALLPYYLAVAAIYGMLAHLTNSILPSMVLHTGGNMLGSLDLLTRGRAEWQAPSRLAPLIWESGVGTAFWGSVIVFVVIGAMAVVAYVALARATRRAAQA